MSREPIDHDTEVRLLAARMRERAAQVPAIAALMPYIIAAEAIRALTYGTDAVASADILVILDAVERAER